MGYEAAFVDQVASSPTVRLDLAGTGWTIRLGTEFGMPELRRAVVSSLLVDGDRYPAAAYGNRTLRLVLRYDAASEDDVATGLQLLYRELDRATNVLRWRPDTTEPVFFRTFRCPPEAVTWDPFTKEVVCLIPAEPFAVGLKESLSAADVPNDPDDTDGMYYDLPTILGDVESPLFLKIRRSDLLPDPPFGAADGQLTSVFGVRRGGDPSAAPVFLQAEDMNTGADTSVQVVAGSSGGSVLRTTFSGSPGEIARGTLTAYPSSASVDARGTYRVFARVKKSVSGDTITMRLAVSANEFPVRFDAVTLPSGTVWRWVDLGLLQIPVGYDPAVDGLSGAPLSAAGVVFGYNAARTSGSGNLEVDVFCFMPADDRYFQVQWPAYSGATSLIIDSAANAVYSVGSSGEVSGSRPETAGLPPMVTPGVDNRLWFIRDVGSAFAAGDLTSTSTRIEPYYWPRYLYVRPVSS